MNLYSTTRKKEIMNLEGKHVKLGIIMITGASQYPKQAAHIFFHTLGVGRREDRNIKHVL